MFEIERVLDVDKVSSSRFSLNRVYKIIERVRGRFLLRVFTLRTSSTETNSINFQQEIIEDLRKTKFILKAW